MTTAIEPVVVAVEVDLPVTEAFRLFTEQMHEWWPVATHSIGEDKVSTIVFDDHAGGRVFERWEGGSEADWADILEWDPPRRFRLAWHPNDTGLSTDVEVAFSPTPAGTRVELVHRGWEVLGPAGAEARADYSSGWIGVLELYRSAASA